MRIFFILLVTLLVCSTETVAQKNPSLLADSIWVEVFSEHSENEDQFKQVLDQVKILFLSRNTAELTPLLEKSKSYGEKENREEWIGLYHQFLAYQLVSRNQFAMSDSLMQESINNYQNSDGFFVNEVSARNTLAFSLYKQKRYEEAFEVVEQSLHTLNEESSPELHPRLFSYALLVRGDAYINLGKFVEGYNDFLSVYDMAQSGISSKEKLEYYNVLIKSANIEDVFGLVEESKVKRREAADFVLSKPDDPSSARAYSLLLKAGGDPDSMFRLGIESLPLLPNKGDQLEIQISLHLSYARALDTLGRNTEVEPLLKKLLAQREKQNDELYARIEVHLAEMYLSEGQIDSAYKYAAPWVDYAVCECQEKSTFVLGEVYKSKGNYKEAIHYSEMYNRIRDSIQLIRSPEKLMSSYSAYRYKVEKAQLVERQSQQAFILEQRIKNNKYLLWAAVAGILLLCGLVISVVRNYRTVKRAKAELEVHSSRLEFVNNKLRRFTGIISHDVISNLDFVLSVGNLLSKGKKTNKELESYFTTNQKVSKELKSYCLELLQEAKKQSAGDQIVSSAKISNLLGQVINQYQEDFDRLGATIEIEPLSPSMLPLPVISQIFQTLITNVLRHAQRPGERLLLSIGETKTDTGESAWRIADNGPGINAETWRQIENGEVPMREKKDVIAVGQGVGLMNLFKQLSFYGIRFKIEENAEGGSSFLMSNLLMNNET